jgi:hypothetical protein
VGAGRIALLYVEWGWKSRIEIGTVLGSSLFENRRKNVGIGIDKLGPLVGRY